MFFVLNLQLMEVDEFQLIAHLFLLGDLTSGLLDLNVQSISLALVLINEAALLALLVLEVLLSPLGSYLASTAILSHSFFQKCVARLGTESLVKMELSATVVGSCATECGNGSTVATVSRPSVANARD